MTEKTLEEVFLNPPPTSGGSKKPTRKIEVSEGHAAVEINSSSTDEVTEDSARELLRSQGLNPDEWAVAGVRVGEWTKPNGELGVSRRFTFKPATAPADPDEVLRDVEDILGDVDWSAHPPLVSHASPHSPSYVVGIGDMQIGKALSDDTPILTTEGWKLHGDIRPGDYVYGKDGKPKKVLAVTGSTEQELYEVELGDGTRITASGDHQWSGTRKMHPAGYRDGGPTWEDRPMTVSTLDLLQITGSASNATRPFVLDAAEPIDLPQQDLPIDPYILGMWLGDGNSHTGTITMGHEDAEHLLTFGHRTDPNGNAFTIRVEGLTSDLRAEGLLQDKHIPTDYLYGSIEQRLALLQGLMDSDGSCDDKGACEFTTTSDKIAVGMLHLLHSMGVRPKVTERIGTLDGAEKKPYWRFRFRTDLPIFRLERKAHNRLATEREGMRRAVKSVTPVGKGMAQCLTVEDSLYLAGKELVVTHNCDGGDTIEDAIERVLTMIDRAAYLVQCDAPPSEIVVAWLGDHVEGFVSQGGASAWRTKLTLTEQSRVVRRLMLYALKVFAPLAPKVTMLAVPGNHGETVRFAGTGITRYDDSHDTEALICVAEVAAEHESEVLRNVTFLVPENDELTVPFTVGELKGLAAHGHKWRPGKHFDWWRGQGFHGNGRDALLLIAGHLHHLLVQTEGKRMFVQVPSTELESTWFKHQTGITGDPGIVVLRVEGERVTGIELVRP